MPILPQNDSGCGWLNILNKRANNPALSSDITTKWLIIGAGYSGLSAAITLAESLPNDEIILIDANGAGEGASARNSGYLVDSTLNDGHLSDTGLKSYKQKYELNKKAVDYIKQLISKYDIDCDWNECGKYYASSTFENEAKLNNFIQLLDKLELEAEFFSGDKLADKLGTDFYKMAVKTTGGAMLQPAALARGMIENLPKNVKLYENTPVINIEYGAPHVVKCAVANVRADNLIIAVNGFMPSLKIKSNRVFPLLLTASLTRELTDSEQQEMSSVPEWGVLSANHMGATLRYTADNRLMIRNTVETSRSLRLAANNMKLRKSKHLKGLKVRFPFLPDDIIQHSWAGITCISANNANIFDEITKNCWAIGCYNGGGIGLASLFGHEIALKAMNNQSKNYKLITLRPKPKWLPPQPFLSFGVWTKLAKDRLKATEEV